MNCYSLFYNFTHLSCCFTDPAHFRSLNIKVDCMWPTAQSEFNTAAWDVRTTNFYSCAVTFTCLFVLTLFSVFNLLSQILKKNDNINIAPQKLCYKTPKKPSRRPVLLLLYEEQNNCFIYFVLFTKRSHVTHSVLLIICQTFVSNMTYLTIFDVLLCLFDEKHICAKYFYKM